MAEFVTPVSSRPIQDRPSKRSRVSPTCTNDQSFDHAIKILINDDQIPAHLKTIVGHLVDKLSGMELLIKRNTELENRLEEGEAEKKRLKEENESLGRALFNKSVGIPSQRGVFESSPKLSPNDVSLVSSCKCEEKERLRSVVVSGIVGCNDANAQNRINYDSDCIRKILHFLNVECAPVSFYRMGKPSKPNTKFPRLLKIVLPSSFFRNDLLRRAPRLKSFPVSGIFIRPSLPKEERERLRALRLARNHSARDDVVNSQHQTVSSRSNQITPSVDQGVAANSTVSPNPPAMSVNI
ncbi:hypothetical protein Aduo_011701 [Ancylostoma duodenale]